MSKTYKSQKKSNSTHGSSIALSLLTSLFVSPMIQAIPVSVQGKATSENAISIGTSSYATAIDGVATGQGSIATGQGFSRDDFAVKVAENKAAVDAVNSKQDELNNTSNQLDSTNNAIGDLTKQIDDLTKQQEAIADKIKQRDALLPTQKDAQDKVNADTDALNDAKTALDNISTNGKNLYLNFTDVLNTLNWSALNGTDAGRNTVASELQSKIESNFTDFAGRYTTQDYRDIVDGYINRQASYQGSYEYFDSVHNKNVRLLGGFSGNNKLFNDLFFNTALNETSYITDYILENKSGELLNKLDTSPYGSDSDVFGKSYLNKDNKPEVGMRLGRRLNENYAHSGYLNPSNPKTFTQKTLNSLVLIDKSIEKSQIENEFNLLNPYNKPINQSNPGNRNFFYFLDSYNSYTIDLGEEFQDKYNEYLFKNYSDINRVIFGLKGVTSDTTIVNMLNYDGNIGILTKLKDFTVSNQNLITTDDITFFKSWYKTLNDYDASIDWAFDKSAINLTDYRANLDKVIVYNNKINTILDLYQSIIDERKKSNADIAKIESETQQLMALKNEVIEGTNDMTNFIAGITPTYNKEWADYYLNYGKTEADAMIARINSELKLYNDKDELIVEATTKAKELQDAYDDAKKKLEEDQAKLDEINDKLNDLELTDTEKATDDVKKAKEDEKAAAEAEKERLEDEIKKGTEELDKLKEELANTSLKDLGLRSQAHGSNAFASGDDSIAMGTNSTVTSNDGIAIGRDTNVTGNQSIALGADNTVTGDKSIVIGVGHTVSGNRSTTIGDPNTITGDDVFVAGNNNSVASNNVMVMGNNITVGTGFDGAVVLGANSTVAAANPTSSIEIQGNTYNFAGTNPTSTVSVGKAGEERQITNVAAGRISETSTDAINGSQLYAVTEALNAIQTINLDDIADDINNAKTTVTAGQGISITENDNVNGSKNYTTSAKLGEGLSFDENGAIRANGTTLRAGDNVEITGDASSGYTISSKTQIINGGKATVVHAGDNVRVTGDVDNGFTVYVDNMRTTVTGGQGAEVTSSDNADGSKNYTVNVKVGEGLTYDDKGNLVNDMKLTAGENVQVSGDAKGGYTISATDTNTQATVSADKGITVTETNNANGTKNYAVSAKLGKGLKVDENGAIAATAQPINGGAGVSITTNAQDEAVVNVAGVTTTTDDGKSYTRSDLTKPVGVKGDGKNIRTSTAANGDVQVKLADDVKVNSVTTGNVSISTKGVNAGGKKVTNVAPAEISPTSTDAVNGSQLHATNIQVHNNTQNIAKLGDRVNHLDTKVNKVNKEARAGIAGTVATASLPQVYMAGKSMVSAAAGHYKNENAVAVGYSRASDNGKLVFKLNSSANTRGDFTVGTGIGYQW